MTLPRDKYLAKLRKNRKTARGFDTFKNTEAVADIKARRSNSVNSNIIRRDRFQRSGVGKSLGRFNNFRRGLSGNGGDLFGGSRGGGGGGGRGRPAGSYDPRYAQYGGVYGYRKILLAQLRAKRLQDTTNNTLTPEQQTLLAQMAQRQRASQMNPESQTIPDTTGEVDTSDYQNEIRRATEEVA